ncbi:hypothetical protein CVT26_004628 [Gymnopilus dilepis]|uniref:Uncharacterized protein n=1 Tax=Gymnopilus dilepis TaxID=231916 RepID=A0A409YTL7_9AGAR|nr:hypothetical protein CVT26_004628 [Gymnopilus dilepis]
MLILTRVLILVEKRGKNSGREGQWMREWRAQWKRSEKGKKADEKKENVPKKSGNANAAEHKDSDGVWQAIEDDTNSDAASDNSLAGLQAVSATKSSMSSSSDASDVGSSGLEDDGWFSVDGDDAHEFDDEGWITETSVKVGSAENRYDLGTFELRLLSA